jgi:hypothetical protein
LKERSTSEGEWCDTSPGGNGEYDVEDGGKDDDEEAEDAEKPEAEWAGERIWPSAWMGFTMPPSTMRAICEKTPRARTEAVGEDGGRRGGGGGLVGDDAVDADEDGVDEGDELVEAAGDDGAAAERLDVADAVEDDEEERVGEAVEVVVAGGPRQPAVIAAEVAPPAAGSR